MTAGERRSQGTLDETEAPDGIRAMKSTAGDGLTFQEMKAFIDFRHRSN